MGAYETTIVFNEKEYQVLKELSEELDIDIHGIIWGALLPLFYSHIVGKGEMTEDKYMEYYQFLQDHKEYLQSRDYTRHE